MKQESNKFIIQFEKLDFATNIISKNVNELTLINYSIEKIDSRDYIRCFSLTEPTGMKTRAVENCDYYRINGSKIWITNLPISYNFVIWWKNENNKIICLISERNDGIKIPEIKEKITLLASPTGYIYMDNLKIPKSNKLNVYGLNGPFICLNKA